MCDFCPQEKSGILAAICLKAEYRVRDPRPALEMTDASVGLPLLSRDWCLGSEIPDRDSSSSSSELHYLHIATLEDI